MTRDELEKLFKVAIVISFMFCMLVVMNGCGQTTGRDGHSCTASSNEVGTYITCTDGSSTFIKNGIDGRDGEDASGVSVVVLCPGTTVYPGTFVEVGFCIDGKLYATYSANGGFSTEIPPGTYSSNGIGNSCTFTVGPNCQVTY